MEGAGEHELNKRKGLWTEEEDRILMDYIMVHGKGRWNRVAKMTGLKRCGKSCRLRWMNYLSPNVKRGDFTEEEEDLIIRLHKLLGNRWALIAGRVPGRTDNQVKNHWNTHLSKKLGIKLQGKRKIGNTSHISSSTLTETGDEKRLKKLIIDSKSSTDELPSIEIGNIAGEIEASILNEDVAITDHDHDQYPNQIQNQNGSLQTSPSNNINEQDPVGYIDDECFFRSFWLCNDHDFHTSTHSSLLEIPDGYPVDMVWHGL